MTEDINSAAITRRRLLTLAGTGAAALLVPGLPAFAENVLRPTRRPTPTAPVVWAEHVWANDPLPYYTCSYEECRKLMECAAGREELGRRMSAPIQDKLAQCNLLGRLLAPAGDATTTERLLCGAGDTGLAMGSWDGVVARGFAVGSYWRLSDLAPHRRSGMMEWFQSSLTHGLDDDITRRFLSLVREAGRVRRDITWVSAEKFTPEHLQALVDGLGGACDGRDVHVLLGPHPAADVAGWNSSDMRVRGRMRRVVLVEHNDETDWPECPVWAIGEPDQNGLHAVVSNVIVEGKDDPKRLRVGYKAHTNMAFALYANLPLSGMVLCPMDPVKSMEERLQRKLAMVRRVDRDGLRWAIPEPSAV